MSKPADVKEEDSFLYSLDSKLLEAFAQSQSWILTPQDTAGLSKLVGKDAVDQLVCTFRCGSQLGIGPTAGNYCISIDLNDPVFPPEDTDYLKREEPLNYSIRQYQSKNVKALEQKLLQFPIGSSFSFTGDLTKRDETERIEITDFLRNHDYSIGNPRGWTCLTSESE